jgi:hypothetical protein
MAGRTKEPIPSARQPIIDELCRLLLRAQRPGATAADSLQAAVDCYALLVGRLTGDMDHAMHQPSSTVQPSGNPLGAAGEPTGTRALEDYRELAMPHYRGRQGDEPHGARKDAPARQSTSSQVPGDPARMGGEGQGSLSGGPDEGAGATATTAAPHDGAAPETAAGTQQPEEFSRAPGRFHYPEWDELAQDYRPAWCTVREQRLPQADEQTVEGAPSFTDQMRARYYGQLLHLRRVFERLRPDRFRKLKRQEQGEEIDLDAVIEAVVDRRAGQSPSDKLYQRRDRRERDVAVALLVDVSGSTGKLLQGGTFLPTKEAADRSEARTPTHSVIQIEKESLFLLAEAVSAVGDALAIYAYSGDGREQVDFFVVKEFDEPYGRRVGERIGAMRALAQNRDGAAIRHAATKLMRQEASTRLLIVLSDSRPFDHHYEGAYALADTRRALLEAHRRQIRTFGITIDQRADDYLAGLFAPNRYTIIDDVRWLPERLPWIYQRVTTAA